MSEITIFGPAVSSYVRTVRWALAEKGVSHELKPVEFGSAAHKALHPFAKVPIMKHGDLTLPESLAIVTYVDANFAGPTLLPKEARARAEAMMWTSHVNAYLYRRLIPDYCLKYVIPVLRGEEPVRAEIEAGVGGMRESLEFLDAGLGERPWFGGKELSIADLFVAPIVASVAELPEAAAALESKRNLGRFMKSVGSRPAWKATLP